MSTQLLQHLRPLRDDMLNSLRELVEHESPSADAASLESLAEIVAGRLRAIGGAVERVAADGEGVDHVFARFDFGADPSSKPALVLGHFDTVWPLGTLSAMPFRVEGGRAFGPGTFDMKVGLVLVEFALRTIRDLGLKPPRTIEVLFTSDEEVGSRTSRRAIEAKATGASYVLVPEPPLPDGGLKTARKGVGRFSIEIQGRSAHAGIEPEKGISAVVELAHQILRINSLCDPALGTTLTAGIVQGGTAVNVVPPHARAEIDVRVTTAEEALRVERDLLATHAALAGASVVVQGGFNRPPMERSQAIADLFDRAAHIARESLGMDLTDGSTGGGSDGNFTAALGVPTLDGLGCPGAGAHAPNEHIQIDSLPDRAALIAALLLGL
ncbi:M20 family metallopeptidase [soil metagenome]